MNALTELRQLFTITEDGRQCAFHDQLDRSTYKKVADVLERLEGKWNKKAGAFVFSYDAKQVIEGVFESGVIPKRNPNQFHPTPRQQVLDMVESSERLQFNLMFGATKCDPDLPAEQRNIRVLEPSIGRMGIANVVKELYPHVDIIGCEIDEVNVNIAREAGYEVTHGDFLSMAIPQTEVEKFDAIIMNPPFKGRDFIKHIRHAQKMLKKNGALVSVVPSEWMKTATSDVEVAFLDEVTRTSSEITTEYDKDTYESTDCTTRIVELVHPEAYAELVAKNKDYWLHLNVVEIENDYAFRVQFDDAGRDFKKALLLKELKARRNIHKTPSAVEWLDEMMALLSEDDEACAGHSTKAKATQQVQTKTASQPALTAEEKVDFNTAVDALFNEINKTMDAVTDTKKPAKVDKPALEKAPKATLQAAQAQQPKPAQDTRFAVLF